MLPGFDPYVTAPISHRRHVIPEGHVDRVSRTAGWISPVLLVDGLIRGTWSPQRSRDGVAIEMELFAPVSEQERHAAQAHAERYETLLGEPVTIHWP